MLFVTLTTMLIVGEIFTMSYPNTKFSKWWRREVIYNEPNK